MAEILTTTIAKYLPTTLHLVFDPVTGVLTQAVLSVQRITDKGAVYDSQPQDLLNQLTTAQRAAISDVVSTLSTGLATTKGVTLATTPTA